MEISLFEKNCFLKLLLNCCIRGCFFFFQKIIMRTRLIFVGAFNIIIIFVGAFNIIIIFVGAFNLCKFQKYTNLLNIY